MESITWFDCNFYDLSSGEKVLKIGQGLTRLRLIIIEKVSEGYFFDSPGIYTKIAIKVKVKC